MTSEQLRDCETTDRVGIIEVGRTLGVGAWVDADTFEAEYGYVQDVAPGDLVVIDSETYAVLGQRTKIDGDPDTPGRARRALVALKVRIRT